MPLSSPSTSLYKLGSGILSIEAWNGSTPPATLIDVGACSSFEVEVTQETLEHRNPRSGLHTIDKKVVILAGYTINFVLDEVSVANLAKYLSGTISGAANHIISANMATDKEYALKFVSDNPTTQNEVWEFHKANLTPNGSFNLLSEEFTTLPFTATGLDDTNNNPTSKYFTVTVATTTTTTTTTTT